MERLETMAEFFTARVEGYDEHMLTNVEGCKEGYAVMASLVPQNAKTLLDLGCGTGLELDEIFKVMPSIKVVGIDITQAMLDKLLQKHPDKNLTLICGDYFKVDLGEDRFDCAVSFETMHHFKKDAKTELYRRIYSSLKSEGVYIECDYMVETQDEEDLWFAENERLKRNAGIDEGIHYHYDTPCTIENQIVMLKLAGFKTAEKVFKIGTTTIIVAKKQ
ncbi:MAG: class I SAM-dependent methyltransferase [Oscillospiraceae bacterium]|nr:class I SAM-dependent methyltransferase [Oscillospiraceae bacterium]